MAKMDFSELTNIIEKFTKAITEMAAADGKDGKQILETLKQDFEQLSKAQNVRIAEAKEKGAALKKLIKDDQDLTKTYNEASKQARRLQSDIVAHKKKLEIWENKPKITKLTAIKIDEIKKTIVKEEEFLASIEKTIANIELQLNQNRIEFSNMRQPEDKNG
ncbi:hypothetical protein EOM81_07275 [bacterium]|nr:hypothetical protein [bacterium]